MCRHVMLVMLVLLTLVATTTAAAAARAESHEPPLAAEAQTRKLLADRAWLSQIARVHRSDAAARVAEAATTAASCAAAGADGACLVVVEPLQPGAAVEGYELVERTALLGVCRQPTDESVASAQIADTRREHALVDTAALTPATREVALRDSLRDDHSAVRRDREESGDDDNDDDESDRDPSPRDDSSGTALPKDKQTVCALPLAPSSSDHSTDVTQTSALAAGPTLEYQVRPSVSRSRLFLALPLRHSRRPAVLA